MQPGFKVMIEFKKQFYPDVFYDHSFLESTFKLLFPDFGAEKAFFDAVKGKGFENKHIIGLYCYGESWAGELVKLDDQLLFEAVMKRLDLFLDRAATENYVKHVVQNWCQEPYIRGAGPNQYYRMSSGEEFCKDLDKKGFFAGDLVVSYLGGLAHGMAFMGLWAAMHTIEKDNFDF